MGNKIIFFTLFFIIGIWQNVFAVPELKLPFKGGENWRVSCVDNDTDAGCEPTHGPSRNDNYALDFNWGNLANSDCGKSIVAAASGVINVGYHSEYGNYIDINHGDGYVTRYAHLSDTTVVDGYRVAQGEQIGLCGTTGASTACHLHFVMYHNGDSVSVEPISGYTDINHGDTGFISDNYYIPMQTYTFPSRSNEGWTTVNNTSFYPGTADTMTVEINGYNPYVYSPMFVTDTKASETVVQFRAKVVNVNTSSAGIVAIKDQTGYWSNSVTFSAITDCEYHNYVIYLSGVANPDAYVKQLEIGMTGGSYGNSEQWEFDWVKVIYIGPPAEVLNYCTSDFSGSIQLPDLDGNGHKEIANLTRHSMTRQPMVTIRDSVCCNVITNIYFLSANVVPLSVIKISDKNGNGYPEIQVTGYENTPKNTKTETRDGKTGELIP